ncbi:MAG: diaminopimelate epimerase, partial [Actinomycetota bacterium]
MTELTVLKAHGSQNDIFILDSGDRSAVAEQSLPELVRRLCDRRGPFGGDGAYFVSMTQPAPEALFFNPDGSFAALCGNGMRCLGRYVLERLDAECTTIRSGSFEFAVRSALSTQEGVVQVAVDLPPPDFDPSPPIVAGGGLHLGERFPVLGSTHGFSALAVPNSHLVAVVDEYTESELIRVGRAVAEAPEVFPIGANVSFVLPLNSSELFVRTYERGAGLTPSCGSGVVASRIVYSRLGFCEPGRRMLIRNPGGHSVVTLRTESGQLFPTLEGNATYVYRTRFDSGAVLSGEMSTISSELYDDEIASFE